MRSGIFSREGKQLLGRIGDLILAWDRHAGGRLSVAYLIAGEKTPLGELTIAAKLAGTTLCSARDPDPRLILVEAGPHRLVLRAVQRLYDNEGVHLGDAMQETWAWADGSLYLNAMLRLVHPSRGGKLIEAATEFAFADGWQPAGGEGICLMHENGWCAAALCYGAGDFWAVPPDGGKPTDDEQQIRGWEPLQHGPPYYRRWGPYYDQWGGSGGWAALRLADGPVLRAVWVEGVAEDWGPTAEFRGTLALVAAGDAAALQRQARAFARPLHPLIEGGKTLYYCPLEGTTVIRKTNARMKVTFPADPEQRQARLHIRIAEDRQPLATGAQALVFPLTHGGVADDPNGPNLLRPDDRHGPILTDASIRPDEVLTTIALAADRQTEFELKSAPGLWLAGQRWDERQQLQLYCSAHPQGALGSFSLRDLKLRDLKIPGDARPLMARLPLYWFQANANSAHHCLNIAQAVELIENGPQAILLRVVGRNPAATAESAIEVRMPFLPDQLRFDMACRFTAIEPWDLPQIQYCNFFPEERFYPQTWGSDRVLIMAGDGQRMRLDHRGSGASRVQAGRMFRRYEGDLFIALYGGPGGSILALSRAKEIGRAKTEYQLCESWLDNHLSLCSDEGPLPANTRYEVDLSLVLAHTTDVDQDIEALGRQALDAGEIAL